MSQKLCVAVAVDGYTSASLVGFAKNGAIVDEPIADILRDIVDALRIIAKDLEIIEQRIWKLEHE